MAPASAPESCTARETMVVSTVSRSSVELTARPDLLESGELSDRARQLSRPRLELAQEPRVLDGDGGLVSEGSIRAIWPAVNGRTSWRQM